MDDEVREILQETEAAEGFYDGSHESLPWTFWLRELHDPQKDVVRMIRIWSGKYLEVRTFGEDPHDEYVYTFRDAKGVGEMFISENMAFQYFTWRGSCRPPSGLRGRGLRSYGYFGWNSRAHELMQ